MGVALEAARQIELSRFQHAFLQEAAKLRMIDLVGRAVLIAVFGGLATLKGLAVFTYVLSFHPADQIRFMLGLATQFVGLAFMLFVISLTLVRLKPIDHARGWEPRISAIAGSFLTLLVPLLQQAEMPRTLQIFSLIVVGCGFLSSTYVVYCLGRSLSVMPQARRLVTSGPYAIVRHPLYLTEEIAVIGILVNYLSWEALVIGVVHWAFQLRRVHNEERILHSTFPEYADYAAQTPPFIPCAIAGLLGKRSQAIQLPAA